jgi:membrane protein
VVDVRIVTEAGETVSSRMTLSRLWAVLKRALSGWWNDNVPHLGAALSYYTLFSLAPILIVAIAIAGLVFGAEAVRGEIVGQIEALVGHDGAVAVQAMLEGAARPSSSVPATIIGVVTFFLGATGAFLELQTALNAIWRVKPKQSGSFLRALILDRLISFGLVLGVGFLMLTSLLVSAGLSALYSYMGETFPGGAVLWEGANVIVTLAVVSILFAMIYKMLPDVELAWSDVWVGGLVTAGFFTMGKFLIGLYLGTSALASSYGAAGSVVVLLLWVFYSAQIVLLGAEFTREYVKEFGRRPPPSEFATKDKAPPLGGKAGKR